MNGPVGQRTWPRALPVLALVVVLTACSANQTAERRKFAGSRYGVQFHGFFCGPGVPPRVAERKDPDADVLGQLNGLYVADDLDAACKLHDICWALYGQQNVDCNQQLQSFLTETDFVDTRYCRRVITAMSTTIASLPGEGADPLQELETNINAVNPVYWAANLYGYASVYLSRNSERIDRSTPCNSATEPGRIIALSATRQPLLPN